MKLSVLDSARIIYGARVAAGPVVVEGDEVVLAKSFDELTSEEREPLLAEINANRQSGEPMQDAIGQAIENALK